MDRRQMTFAQTQTKKSKSKKLRTPKLRCPGTTALAKQKRLIKVNKIFIQLEQDCKNLLAANTRLVNENTKLRKTMELHAGDVCSANNEAMAFKSQWDDAEEHISKLTVELQNCKDLLDVQLSPDEAQRLKVEAYNDGLSAFAWWKNGVQYVGTCGTLLKDYLKETPQSKANRKMKKKVYDPGSGYDENGNEYG